MIDFSHSLNVRNTPLYLDARSPSPLSFVSHAHTDHLARHQLSLASHETAVLAASRGFAGTFISPEYFCEQLLSTIVKPLPETAPNLPTNRSKSQESLSLTLLPAGHVLGSAMLHVRTDNESLLYTGDYKLRLSRTCPPAQLRNADHLLMECTYGLPRFRFPDTPSLEARLIDSVTAALARGEQPIVCGYALGKAQEALHILTAAGLPVTAHGAVYRLTEVYESLLPQAARILTQSAVPPLRPYRRHDFHGPTALPLEQRGVLLAPPQAARSAFATAFPRRHIIMLSGWGMDPSARYRYGVDEVIPLSDHADYDELWQTIDTVSPKVVWLHHGFVREFGDALRAKGIDARPARPDPQGQLFA